MFSLFFAEISQNCVDKRGRPAGLHLKDFSAEAVARSSKVIFKAKGKVKFSIHYILQYFELA
jgi:hypothetical protein